MKLINTLILKIVYLRIKNVRVFKEIFVLNKYFIYSKAYLCCMGEIRDLPFRKIRLGHAYNRLD
jgi:hypothetical protein